MVIRPWLNLPTGGHGHVICMSNLGGVFSQENTPEGHTKTHKSSFFSYKQVSGRNSDHEWLRMTNAFILCDLIWKVQKCHAANKEGSFKYYLLQSGQCWHLTWLLWPPTWCTNITNIQCCSYWLASTLHI